MEGKKEEELRQRRRWEDKLRERTGYGLAELTIKATGESLPPTFALEKANHDDDDGDDHEYHVIKSYSQIPCYQTTFTI